MQTENANKLSDLADRYVLDLGDFLTLLEIYGAALTPQVSSFWRMPNYRDVL
jgi:hypothetical protein